MPSNNKTRAIGFKGAVVPLSPQPSGVFGILFTAGLHYYLGSWNRLLQSVRRLWKLTVE